MLFVLCILKSYFLHRHQSLPLKKSCLTTMNPLKLNCNGKIWGPVYKFLYYGYVFNSTGGHCSSVVERVTPGEEVSGSIPAVVARSLLVGSVSV